MVLQSENNYLNLGMAGRPPLFESPEQLETAVKQYFSDISNSPYTITGIALWLGFADRQSLYDYQERPEYSCIIKELRTRVENGYEQRLFANNPTGAIFALKNMGWRDKVETGFTNSNGEDVQPQIIFQPAPNCNEISNPTEE